MASNIEEVLKFWKFHSPQEKYLAKWSTSEISKLVHEGGCFVAKMGNQLTALLICTQPVAGEQEILQLIVDPAFRKKGQARQLMEYFVSQSPSTEFFLEVSAKNYPAISFYKSFEFIEVGVRTAYYSNGDDALVLRKKIKK